MAIPHMSTKNNSFLRTALLLHKMGIKNNAFMLALYDPDLLHVDPHDLEEETPENLALRVKVQIEARINIWYFFREVIRIYSQGGKPVPFKLDRGNLAMTWCFANSIDYAGMQPRQTGKTVGALSIFTWMLFAGAEEFQIGMMAKDNKLRQDNVARIKRLSESLPSWWLIKDRLNDKSNAESIRYAAFRTELATTVAQDNEVDADKQGRGASLPCHWWDEFEYCANIAVSYSTIIASGGAARKNAKMNGQPHSNLITTTAGDPAKKECQQAAKILNGAMPFTEQLYDLKDNDELLKVVEANSPQGMIIGVFSHLQLGLSNDWLRGELRKANTTPDKIMRDYLNRRVSIQEKPIINPNTLAAINSSAREPKFIDIRTNKFVLYWYLDKEVVSSQAFKRRPIIVGCDSSEMINRDATTLVGVDPQTLETVFTFRCSAGNINAAGAMIAHLLIEFPGMVFIPENKSSGTSIIDIVAMILRAEGHNPFMRIFNWIVQNKSQEKFAQIDIRNKNLIDTEHKRYFGIKTNKSQRDDLYLRVLFEACERSCNVVRDKMLIKELSSLTERNGRVDHAEDGHDDTVVAWLLAMWLILNGMNLDVYGIKPGTILSNVISNEDQQAKKLAARQAFLQAKISDLKKTLATQTNLTARKFIESDIKLYESMLDNVPVATPTTADEIHRDPRKFVDQQVAEQSRTPVSSEQITNSLKFLMLGSTR